MAKEKVLEAFAKLSDLVKAQFGDNSIQTPAVVTEFAQVKTLEGALITIEGEVAVGTPVTIQTEAGTIEPAPEGKHTLEDGTVIVITGGVISEVIPAMVAPTEEVEEVMEQTNPLEEKVKEMEAKLAALEAKLSGLQFASVEELNNVKNVALSTFKVVEELVTVPAPKQDEKPTQKFKREEKLNQLSNILKTL